MGFNNLPPDPMATTSRSGLGVTISVEADPLVGQQKIPRTIKTYLFDNK
jgi:hypothetical protein